MSALPPEVWCLSLAKVSGKQQLGWACAEPMGREGASKPVTISLERQEVTGANASDEREWDQEVLTSFQGR